MKKLIVKTFSGILVFSLLVFAASRIWIEQTADLLLSMLQLSAGLEDKVVQTSLGPIHYLEGGHGETVVFVHGIFARKAHWIEMSRQVSGKYRVILLDLPGFGDNKPLADEAYGYRHQSRNLMNVLDKIGLKRFHIVANSMGGQIAGTIAHANPDRVLSIAFVGSPDGIRSPIPSDMEKALLAGKLPLVATSEADYEHRMNWLFPNPPYLPGPVNAKWRNSEVRQAALNKRIWNEVRNSDAVRLEQLASKIKQPSLIIWCKNDRIFHHSGSDILHAALPDSKQIKPEKCGHLPMLDRPIETGQELFQFLSSL